MPATVPKYIRIVLSGSKLSAPIGVRVAAQARALPSRCARVAALQPLRLGLSALGRGRLSQTRIMNRMLNFQRLALVWAGGKVAAYCNLFRRVRVSPVRIAFRGI